MTDNTAPNILLVMADQLAASVLPTYGHPLVRTPHLSSLAAGGVVFDSAYCNSPQCAPSRFSMLSGRLPSAIGAYDNAAEFPASVPTFAHGLRARGYRTCLAGKMHFVGADQLHGYEQRITADVYPAGFGWVPDWENPMQRQEWFHNMLSVTEAGIYERTLQLDFDDEVAFHGARWLYDVARDDDPRPFFLTVSFTQPHDPYMTPKEYWDRYDHSAVDPPRVAPIPVDDQDPHSRRLHHSSGMHLDAVSEADVLNARHAYFGMVSYIDDQVGALVEALRQGGMAEDTIIVFTADHGDMLGERGLWYKMCFFEDAARVPLIVHAPGRFPAHRVAGNVSLLDLFPTVLDLAQANRPPNPLEGRSLLPDLMGEEPAGPDTVLAEYMGEGAIAPCLMVRRGTFKSISCDADPPQLFDLSADPLELENLAGHPDFEQTESDLVAIAAERWDAPAIHEQVLTSQRRRRLVYAALHRGRISPWDFVPVSDAAGRYIRNESPLVATDRLGRLPDRSNPPPRRGS